MPTKSAVKELDIKKLELSTENTAQAIAIVQHIGHLTQQGKSLLENKITEHERARLRDLKAELKELEESFDEGKAMQTLDGMLVPFVHCYMEKNKKLQAVKKALESMLGVRTEMHALFAARTEYFHARHEFAEQLVRGGELLVSCSLRGSIDDNEGYEPVSIPVRSDSVQLDDADECEVMVSQGVTFVPHCAGVTIHVREVSDAARSLRADIVRYQAKLTSLRARVDEQEKRLKNIKLVVRAAEDQMTRDFLAADPTGAGAHILNRVEENVKAFTADPSAFNRLLLQQD